MGVLQHKSFANDTQSVSITLDAPVSAGNLLILVVGHNASDPLESISGASFTQRFSDTAAGLALAIYDAPITSSGSPEITANFSSFDNQHQLHLYEVTYQTFDKSSEGLNSPGASAQTGFLGDTAQAAELVLGVFLTTFGSTPSMSAGTGYTAGETTMDASAVLFSEFKELSSVGNPNATATASISSPGEWINVIAGWYGAASVPTETGGSWPAYERIRRGYAPPAKPAPTFNGRIPYFQPRYKRPF